MFQAGSDRGNNTLTNAGNDRLFRRTTNQLFQVGSNGHSCTNSKFDTIFGDRAKNRFSTSLRIRAINDLRINTGSNRVHYVTAGKVNGCRTVEIQIDPGTLRRNDRVDDA